MICNYSASLSQSQFYSRRGQMIHTPPHPPPARRYWSSLHTVWHTLFALLLAALPLTAEAQNRTPPATATISHNATSISLRAPDGPPRPIYFLSHKVEIYPHPGSTTWDHTNSQPCIVPGAVLRVVPRMFGNGYLAQTISIPIGTCGSHTAGETFQILWSGNSSKAWQTCWSTAHGQVCGYRRSGTGTPARAYFSFDTGSNCQTKSVVTTQMGLVTGATDCWTTVTIQ